MHHNRSRRDPRREGPPDESLYGCGPPSDVDLPTESALAAYWLSHCEGFLVDTPEGAVGVVDDVRLDPETGIAEALIASGGWSPGGPVCEIPVTEVLEILPVQRRIVVRVAPEPAPQRPRGILRRLARSLARRVCRRSPELPTR